MNGSEGDVLLNSEKEMENEKQEIMVEGVENENVKEEVEDKEKTRNESVREEVEEKVRNDEKEFGEKKENEKRGKLEENSILVDVDSCQLWEEKGLELTPSYVDDDLIEVVGFRDAWHGLVCLLQKGTAAWEMSFPNTGLV
nr:hypothetical protein Itr_chr06CG15330 [Ipomoea trifida]